MQRKSTSTLNTHRTAKYSDRQLAIVLTLPQLNISVKSILYRLGNFHIPMNFSKLQKVSFKSKPCNSAPLMDLWYYKIIMN